MIQVNYNYGHEGYDGWVNDRPNSAGGVSVLFSLKNIGTKTIKYYSLYFIPYNAVGDMVSCSVSDVVTYGVNGTGPLGPNETRRNGLLTNAWYSYSIKRIVLDRAEIQYMDGSEETIKGNNISRIPAAPQSTGGCYIATAVYGSYDCPEVWTLRRYRDFTLAKTWFGRFFIRTYYAISPTFVKIFGKTKIFSKIFKKRLDKKVKKLQEKGVESTSYVDENW